MRRINFKAFFVSLISQFVITVALNLGLQHSSFFSYFSIPTFFASHPLVSAQTTKPDIFPGLLPKLEATPDQYTVKPMVTFAASSGEYDQVSSFGVVNLTSGEMVLGNHINDSVPIASLTKVMTAVVALDLASADEAFTVSDQAANIEPTRLGEVPGQKLRVSELVNAMILTSANDAAQTLKEGVEQKYSQPGIFVRAMNEKAHFLGLSHTKFANPQGFDDANNYSSIADLAVLTHYALSHYPLIKEAAIKDYQFYPADQGHKQIDLYNWNGLLGVYPGVNGLKIGNTDAAKYTTIVTCTRGDQTLVAIVLGAPGVLERDLSAAQLLDQAFAKTANLPPVGVTKPQLKAKYASWKYWN